MGTLEKSLEVDKKEKSEKKNRHSKNSKMLVTAMSLILFGGSGIATSASAQGSAQEQEQPLVIDVVTEKMTDSQMAIKATSYLVDEVKDMKTSHELQQQKIESLEEENKKIAKELDKLKESMKNISLKEKVFRDADANYSVDKADKTQIAVDNEIKKKPKIVINEESVNFRESADLSSKIIDYGKKGVVYYVLDTSELFYKTSKGWVSKSVVKSFGEPAKN